jgi:hypothetical protein
MGPQYTRLPTLTQFSLVLFTAVIPRLPVPGSLTGLKYSGTFLHLRFTQALPNILSMASRLPIPCRRVATW